MLNIHLRLYVCPWTCVCRPCVVRLIFLHDISHLHIHNAHTHFSHYNIFFYYFFTFLQHHHYKYFFFFLFKMKSQLLMLTWLLLMLPLVCAIIFYQQILIWYLYFLLDTYHVCSMVLLGLCVLGCKFLLLLVLLFYMYLQLKVWFE